MSPASLPGEGRASDRQQPEALKAGVAGDGLADAGPVDVLALLGDRLQQMVAHQAQQWHGHAALVGGLADQSHVLQAERRLEAGGGKALLDQDAAVGAVDWPAPAHLTRHLLFAVIAYRIQA